MRDDDFASGLRRMADRAAQHEGDGEALVTPALTARTLRRRRVHDTAVASVSAAAITAVILAGAALAEPRPEPLPPAAPTPTQTSAPTTAPPPSPSMSPSPSSEPPETPESSEPAVATAPPPLETLVVTAAGLGPLALGSTVPTEPSADDIIWLDGEACAGTDAPARWVAAYPDGSMANGSPGSPFDVLVMDGQVLRVEVLTAGPRTSGGIQVGSTLAELRAAHPEMALVPSGERAIELWVVQDGPNSLVVEVSTNAAVADWWTDDEVGRVVSIVAMTGVPDQWYYPAWGGDFCG